MTTPPEERRRPGMRALAVLVFITCQAILATLGTWQAGRFLDKRETFATMEERQAMAPAALTSATQLTEDLDYRTVTLEGGTLLMDRTALVIRRFHKHLPGNWTLTPYRFGDGTTVLVHTGWFPEQKPEFATNPPALLQGIVVTPGRVKADDMARADEAFELRDLPELGELDAEFLYGELEGLQAPPRLNTIVALNGPDEPLVYPTPSYDHITNPYLTPAIHFGYASLWFGSALLMIWLFWAGWTGRLDPSAR